VFDRQIYNDCVINDAAAACNSVFERVAEISRVGKPIITPTRSQPLYAAIDIRMAAVSRRLSRVKSMPPAVRRVDASK
jgi:hypothetical protein